MNDYFKLLGYKISDEDDLLDKENYLTPLLKDKIQKLHRKVMNGDKKVAEILIKLIKKHPKNPQLKNLLCGLYSNLGNDNKAFAVNNTILKAHPNYLFGKLNLANEYYLNKEYEKMPEILGEEMEIQKLYPNRDTFHISEVKSFLVTAIKYFAATNNFEEAKKRLEILETIDDIGVHFEDADKILKHYKTLNTFNKFQKLYEKNINVKYQNPTNYKQTISKPSFYHKEIETLYENEFEIIADDIFIEILNLPKKTLQKDLEKVLIDSFERYDFFNEQVEKEGYQEEKYAFVIHALFLLKEIETKSSLPLILDVLRQSEEYIDLFLSHFLTEDFWQVITVLGDDDLEMLKTFMLEKGLYSFAKSTVSDAVIQMYFHKMITFETVVNWNKEILEFYLNANIDDNIVDSILIGNMISDLIDINAIELLPLIEKLYKKEYVDLMACGDYETVKKEFKIVTITEYKRKIQSISSLYDAIFDNSINELLEEVNSSSNKSIFSNNESYDDYIDSIVETIVKDKKVGRNEPCPCGSGKKYKKCCLNK